jgi:hypothetical protein
MDWAQEEYTAVDKEVKRYIKTDKFVTFRHTLQFFSLNMVTFSFYWWKKEPRYIMQCIWGETTDLPQVK